MLCKFQIFIPLGNDIVPIGWLDYSKDGVTSYPRITQTDSIWEVGLTQSTISLLYVKTNEFLSRSGLFDYTFSYTNATGFQIYTLNDTLINNLTTQVIENQYIIIKDLETHQELKRTGNDYITADINDTYLIYFKIISA